MMPFCELAGEACAALSSPSDLFDYGVHNVPGIKSFCVFLRFAFL